VICGWQRAGAWAKAARAPIWQETPVAPLVRSALLLGSFLTHFVTSQPAGMARFERSPTASAFPFTALIARAPW